MKLFRFFNKNIFIITVLVIGFFLRVDKLSEYMVFIPDQGLFYLPARDMILYGKIPLVGPETSHPWIHHGALWTYVLAIIFMFFRFDPVMPAYFIAILGVATILLFYIALKSMFDEKTAILGSILYATSPLIVMNARIAYHTSPIPFFVIFLFFLTFKFIKGSAWVFPIITLLLGVLYNHEITTFVYFITIGIILGFGFIKKKKWFKKLHNKKLILASIISFLIPMTPFILYDISHGWRQTVGFLVWVLYRVVKFPLSLIDQSFVSPGSNPSTLPEFFSYYKQLIFAQNDSISFIILLTTGFFVTIKIRRKITLEYILLFLFLTISLVGLSIHRAPIEADTLLIAPFIVILTAISLLWATRNNFALTFIFVLIISGLNLFFLLSTNFLTNGPEGRITFKKRLEAVERVISVSDRKPYNIIGRGELNNFRSFTMPYEYLLWWKGHAPESKKVPFKIVIWEKGNEVIVNKE